MLFFNRWWHVAGLGCLILGGLGLFIMTSKETEGSVCIGSAQELKKLFPSTVSEINHSQKRAELIIHQTVSEILAVPANQRTFENTALVYDQISIELDVISGGLLALKELSPIAELRQAAQQALINLNKTINQKLILNPDIYHAFKEYIDDYKKLDKLNNYQKYFLQETMSSFERSGLNLPAKELSQVRTLVDEIDQLSHEFAINIAQDQSKISVTADQLTGLPIDFIENLAKDENGNYLVGCDYPTFMKVIKTCQNSNTRKMLLQAFNRRAYPENEQILTNLIAKRDELSKLLGFESYAHLDLDSQMALTPDRAIQFLKNVQKGAQTKAEKEINYLKNNLPKGVDLIDGKIAPWDLQFLQTAAKLRDLNIDEQTIAEHFVLESTLDALFKVYEKFLGLKLIKTKVQDLWSNEVQALEIYQASTNQLLGYLLLDLFPRPNKFSHAAAFMVVPAILPKAGKPLCPAVGVVMANFPRSTNNKPALMTYYDVKTFFHEFGHALHGIIGRTALASHSGLKVKTDFVEMPSQMLEDWLTDGDILKNISAHYISGEPLSQSIINKLVDLEKFDAGHATCRQLCFGLLSLALFGPGQNKDIQAIKSEIWQELTPYLIWDENDRFEAAFGHLTGYGAKYYGYLWSKVFAKDLFASIKKQGLLNPKVGQAYVDKVLSQGGQKDPNQLLRDFLQRDPNQDAFTNDLGF